MPKVLITGALGFVANHLIPLLIPEYQIIGLVLQTPQTKPHPITYLECDITDSQAINSIITAHKPEFIIHLAAVSQSWNTDVTKLFQTNLTGTLNIYQSILNQKSYSPKIIYVSSSEVYGQTNNSSSIDESSSLNPINTYAVSKLSADRLSYQFSYSHNLNVTILRPFPHAGPGQSTGFFVPDMASQIVTIEQTPATTNQISVGNLTSIRDYTDVRDMVRAYYLALTSNLPQGEVYNISSDHGIAIQDIFTQLTHLSTVDLSIHQDPNKLRPIDIPIAIGNSAKFRQATNWQPHIPLVQTLTDTLNYYRNLQSAQTTS